MHRQRLLSDMLQVRTATERFVANHLAQPGILLDGGWDLHDAVAHVALWDRMAVRKLTGTPLPDGEDVIRTGAWDLHRFNDLLRTRLRDRPMPTILAEFDAAWAAVVAVVSTASNDECAPGGRVWTVIDDSSAGHYPRHFPVYDVMADRIASTGT